MLSTDNVRGALFMALAMAGFVINDTMMKLVFADLELFQAIFLRNSMLSLLIAAVALQRGELLYRPVRADLRVIGLRVVGEVGSAVCFLTALYHMPIANATAIIQAIPLAITLAAALFLGERVGWRRILAILIGLAGVLLIVKPQPSAFTIYDGFSLGLIVAIALRDIFTRGLPLGVPTLIVVLANAAFVMLSGLALYPFEDWVALDQRHLLLLFCGGIFLSIGYVCMVSTIRMDEISATAIYRYSVVLFALISGIAVFGEFPDQWALLGIALIVISGIYALLREMRASRRE